MIEQRQDEAPSMRFKDVMDYLNVSRSTVYRLIWSGQLPWQKVGSTYRFYKSDVKRCVKGSITVSETEQCVPVMYALPDRAIEQVM